MKKRWVVLVLLFGLLALVGCQGKETAGGEVGPFKGQKAPEFTLQDMKDNKIQLSDYKGKSVALVFWASWCPPCRQEIPSLIELDKKLQGTSSQIISINLTSGDKLEDVKTTVSEKGITYPVLLDEKGDVGALYGVRSIPTTVVLDKDGVVVDYRVGAYDDISQLEKLLKDYQ